jgi:hypothetical protein
MNSIINIIVIIWQALGNNTLEINFEILPIWSNSKSLQGPRQLILNFHRHTIIVELYCRNMFTSCTISTVIKLDLGFDKYWASQVSHITCQTNWCYIDISYVTCKYRGMWLTMRTFYPLCQSEDVLRLNSIPNFD